MTNKKYKCCICGGTFTGFGNNPWPLVNDEESRCCDDCNFKYVVMARLVNSQEGKQVINEKNAPDFIYSCATAIAPKCEQGEKNG